MKLLESNKGQTVAEVTEAAHKVGAEAGVIGVEVIENSLIGLVIVIALVIAIYAILPTFFASTNNASVTALGAPAGTTGIFTAVPILGGILFAIAIIVIVVKVAMGSSRGA